LSLTTRLALWRGKEVAVKVLSNVNLEAQIEEFKKEFKVILCLDFFLNPL
jgi:hypothetical protein